MRRTGDVRQNRAQMMPPKSLSDLLHESTRAMRLVDERTQLFLQLVGAGANRREIEAARQELQLVRALADATIERVMGRLKGG